MIIVRIPTAIRAAALVCAIIATGTLQAADIGLKNGDFTTGKQFWRGDGTVVTLPDGNKVIELNSNPRRQSQVYQEIELGTLVEVEVRFRARFLGAGKGQMRAKLTKRNGASTLFAFDLPPDGQWRDIDFKHQRENLKDTRSLVLETLPYDGILQIDDVWAGATGTHTSVRPMTPTSAPPKPAAPVVAVVPAPAVPMPAVAVVPVPATPMPAVAPAPSVRSSNYTLDQILDSLPAALRAKMTTTDLPPGTMDEINSYLAAEVKNKPLQIALVVHTAEVVPNDQSKFRIRADDGLLSGKYPAVRQHWFWAYTPTETATELSQVSIGAAITLVGKVSRCDLEKRPAGFRLNVDLQNSQLVTGKAADNTQKTNESRLNDSEWVWGSGGTLKLLKNGTATHTAWNAAGSWKLIDDKTMSLQRPGNDPPMTVIFTNPDLTNGGVTSYTGGKTTITRTK